MASFETFRGDTPHFILDTVFGGLPGDELRKRTLKMEIIDNAHSYDEILLTLNNRDGLVTSVEFLSLGLLLRVRYGYSENTSDWRAYVISRAKGGIGCRTEGVGLTDSEGIIVLRGRNRNAPDARNKGRPKVPRVTGRGRGEQYVGKGGGATGDVTYTETLHRKDPRYSDWDEFPRRYLVTRVSDAVEEIARRMGYPRGKIFIEQTEDQVSEVVLPSGIKVDEWLRHQALRFEYTYKCTNKEFRFHSVRWKGLATREKHTFDFSRDPNILKLSVDADFTLPVPSVVKARSYDPILNRVGVADVGVGGSAGSTQQALSYASVLNDSVTRQPRKLDVQQFLRRKEELFHTTGGARNMTLTKAQKRYVDRHIRAMKLTLTSPGNHTIEANDEAILKNIGNPIFDKNWHIGQARHIFDGSTYQTILGLSAARPKGGDRIIKRAGVSDKNSSTGQSTSYYYILQDGAGSLVSTTRGAR